MGGVALHLYLPSPMREHAQAGQVNIVNRIGQAVAPLNWHLVIHADSAEERAKAPSRAGYTLFHMQDPQGERTLTMRRALFYPFWQIEATNQRWMNSIARAAFDPATVDPVAARVFVRRWRDKLFGSRKGRRDGFIFMPLQGRLRTHRSFQTMSPVAMIETTLEADPRRRIRATLHPREDYDAADLVALDALSRAHPRFALVTDQAEDLLAGCDYVVTQNSSVALMGFFLHKQAVLFADIDFHHVAGLVSRDGVDAAFARAQRGDAAYEPYLAWYFRQHCVNGGAPEAEVQIRARFARFGWPVG